MASSPPVTAPIHLVVVVGRLTADPVVRPLADGEVWQFDLATTVTDGGIARRSNVPVSWPDPPAGVRASLCDDTDVLVVGTVRRRFFRAGGVTQSRTEVVPDQLVPLRRRASVRSALAAAVARIEAA